MLYPYTFALLKSYTVGYILTQILLLFIKILPPFLRFLVQTKIFNITQIHLLVPTMSVVSLMMDPVSIPLVDSRLMRPICVEVPSTLPVRTPLIISTIHPVIRVHQSIVPSLSKLRNPPPIPEFLATNPIGMPRTKDITAPVTLRSQSNMTPTPTIVISISLEIIFRPYISIGLSVYAHDVSFEPTQCVSLPRIAPVAADFDESTTTGVFFYEVGESFAEAVHHRQEVSWHDGHLLESA